MKKEILKELKEWLKNVISISKEKEKSSRKFACYDSARYHQLKVENFEHVLLIIKDLEKQGDEQWN